MTAGRRQPLAPLELGLAPPLPPALGTAAPGTGKIDPGAHQGGPPREIAAHLVPSPESAALVLPLPERLRSSPPSLVFAAVPPSSAADEEVDVHGVACPLVTIVITNLGFVISIHFNDGARIPPVITTFCPRILRLHSAPIADDAVRTFYLESSTFTATSERARLRAAHSKRKQGDRGRPPWSR
eukprot:CAMPEP_0181202284 /NCGR_PEP_ID=MMETSP1096-20121128/18757_1 /TAXON_ID=156174 ORGANISM="Chrysochromulina ericina, Strain CCMP281" /NCGR_SAMPLE_ID=MMETSP1096 /ASSEMBLY_ACC=CAM_ASM_000453 /LENGTH=183 /DNA_ID=CAMNT_0023292781 /DNA_START=604 /DNA_END=1153 /DNA_ORIENTATION=+